jgi:hypothetical protein
VPLPDAPKRLAFRPGRKMGSLARRLDQPKILYRGLRPEALATLLYIAKEYRRIAGQGTLRVTSTVRDLPYQDLLVQSNIQATPSSRSTRPASRSTSPSRAMSPCCASCWSGSRRST